MSEAAKVCTWCKKPKPISEFRKSKDTSDGFRSECRACKSIYDSERHANLTDEEKSVLATRLANNHLKRKYGITLDDYYVILDSQGGECVICGVTEDDENRRLAVDHDHDTGKVRGLLCYNCNRGLGHFQNSPRILRDAAEYLEDYYASVNGSL